MNTEAVLWGRRARVSISLPSGTFSDTNPEANTLVIEGGNTNQIGLRIVFKVTKTSQKEPNTLEGMIYNLSPTTRAALQQKGVRLLLEAGYVATGLAQVFVGDVRTIDHIRDGADWKTIIKCGDGERAFRYSRISESFAAGATMFDVVKRAANSMGVALGNTAAQAAKLATPLYHGWVSHGAASSALDKAVKSLGYDYSIQNGVLQILAPNESLAQSIPVVSPQTGLIGSPEMGSPEKKGEPSLLKFKALLMPEALPGGRVQVISERYNGIFRTRKVDHSGDTMGGSWYSEYESIQDTTASAA